MNKGIRLMLRNGRPLMSAMLNGKFVYKCPNRPIVYCVFGPANTNYNTSDLSHIISNNSPTYPWLNYAETYYFDNFAKPFANNEVNTKLDGKIIRCSVNDERDYINIDDESSFMDDKIWTEVRWDTGAIIMYLGDYIIEGPFELKNNSGDNTYKYDSTEYPLYVKVVPSDIRVGVRLSDDENNINEVVYLPIVRPLSYYGITLPTPTSTSRIYYWYYLDKNGTRVEIDYEKPYNPYQSQSKGILKLGYRTVTTPVTYTVTFYNNDGSVLQTYTFNSGEKLSSKISKLPSYTNLSDNEIFLEWNTDKNGNGTTADLNMTVSKNISFYPVLATVIKNVEFRSIDSPNSVFANYTINKTTDEYFAPTDIPTRVSNVKYDSKAGYYSTPRFNPIFQTDGTYLLNGKRIEEIKVQSPIYFGQSINTDKQTVYEYPNYLANIKDTVIKGYTDINELRINRGLYGYVKSSAVNITDYYSEMDNNLKNDFDHTGVPNLGVLDFYIDTKYTNVSYTLNAKISYNGIKQIGELEDIYFTTFAKKLGFVRISRGPNDPYKNSSNSYDPIPELEGYPGHYDYIFAGFNTQNANGFFTKDFSFTIPAGRELFFEFKLYTWTYDSSNNISPLIFKVDSINLTPNT